MPREGASDGPQRRDYGQEVSQSERPIRHDEGVTGYGQEGSSDGVITSSRTSQPGGCSSAKTTARATSSGRFSI